MLKSFVVNLKRPLQSLVRPVLSLLVPFVCLVAADSGRAANIMWVTDDIASDQTMVNYVSSLGYNVNVRNDLTGTLSPADLNDLNSVALVIVSRNTSSGNYGAAQSQWNTQVSTPLILGSPYLARTGGNNGWSWIDGGGVQANYNGDVRINPGFEADPLFGGVTITGTGFGGQPIFKYWNGDRLDIAEGTSTAGPDGDILGVRNNATFPRTIIAQFNAGDEVGGGDILAGDRLFLALPGTPGNPGTFADLNQNGQILLANAIGLMIPEPGRAVLAALGLFALLAPRRRPGCFRS